MYRTHNCNELGEKNIGEVVELAGWVDSIRDHGGVIFMHLRDEKGVTQVVVHDEALMKNVCRETVITVKGKVERRDEETVNDKIATGKIELVASSLEILGPCRNMLPFDIEDSKGTREEVRLKQQVITNLHTIQPNGVICRK